MGGRMPFRGPFRGPPGGLGGPGGRLGGFGMSGPSAPVPKPSEPESPTTTTTTTTEAPVTTEPSGLFAELATKKVTTTPPPPSTPKPFWEKNALDNNFSGERSRGSFIDNITKFMEISPRNRKDNRCLECKNAPNPAACLEKGHVKQCGKNEACQTEIRWENGRTRIVSSCKQWNACQVMFRQNGANCGLNRKKVGKQPRTCWKCCRGDLCNIADLSPKYFK